jgi:hypothetical protein
MNHELYGAEYRPHSLTVEVDQIELISPSAGHHAFWGKDILHVSTKEGYDFPIEFSSSASATDIFFDFILMRF